MLLFAILYTENFDGNIYYGKEKVKEWASSALDYWTNIQNPDGSFSEIYPNERSFCGTSFSTYAATETMLILNEHTNLRNITKAGNWLISHSNSTVANQVAGSIVALYNIYLLTGIESFEKAAIEKTEILISLQHQSGYYPEYGGYDIGYQTITLSFLAKYYFKSKYERLRKSLDKGIEFIRTMTNERGDFEISGTSRKTQYFYPHGFSLLEEQDMIQRNLTALKDGTVVNPAWMDDRYCIAYATDYLQTYLKLGS